MRVANAHDMVRIVLGSGASIAMFRASPIDNASLPPCVFVRITATPSRLLALPDNCAGETLPHPNTAAFVHRN